MKKVETYYICSLREYKKVRKMLHEKLVDYFSGDKMLVDLAMYEAVKNAWEHGNQQNSDKPIQLKIYYLNYSMIARIEDQGEGFNWSEVESSSNEKAQKSGLQMIGQIMDRVVYSEKGNEILLRKWVS